MRSRGVALVLTCLTLSGCLPAALRTPDPASPATVSPSPTGAAPSASATSAAIAADPTSADQYTWVQASAPIDRYTLQTSVAATPLGYVAVGVRMNTELPEPSATFAPGSNPLASLYIGVVWTSADGRTWSRIPDAPDFHSASMTKVVGTADGALIFGSGGVCLPDACGGLPPNGGTVVWGSSDGGRWTRLPGTGLEAGAVSDVVRTASGYVAVGYVASSKAKPVQGMQEPTDAAVWRSADGRTWTAVAGLPRGADRLVQVQSDGGELTAVGTTSTTLDAWTSADGGATWAAGPSLADICCTSHAISGGTMVVAGPDDSTAEKPVGVVSTSDGHGKWTRATPTAIRGIRPAWVEVIGTSVVVFGWTFHRDSVGVLLDDQERAFMSADAKSWARFELPTAWEGVAPIATAARGRDLVAIVGPLDTMNGPSAQLSTTIWLGTAGG
jgi:hypothetical protein